MAWHYKKDPELAQLEDNAIAAKTGLWSQPNPVAAWDFRNKGRTICFLANYPSHFNLYST